MREVWKPVVGYEETYHVSNKGRVRRVSSGKIRKACSNGKRMVVNLCQGGVIRSRKVHHLVLEAFVGLRPQGTECCHGDGNYQNNRLTNLRWDTPLSNCLDAIEHGTRVRQVLRSDGVVFDSAADAANHHGLSPGSIRACCRGVTSLSDGFGWEYV